MTDQWPRNLPTDIDAPAGLPESAKAALRPFEDELATVTARQQQTKVELDKAQRELSGAKRADRLALAQAIRRKGADPGGEAVKRVEEQIADLERQRAALALARRQIVGEAADVVRAQRAAFIRDCLAAQARAHGRRREAFDQLRPVMVEPQSGGEALAWLRVWPERSRGAAEPRVSGLRTASGESYYLSQVLDALAAFLAEDPAAPETQPDDVDASPDQDDIDASLSDDDDE